MINIFITNLGKYNEGELIGEWVTLPATEDEIEEVLKEIGINEEYEEYFITDYETDISLEIHQYSNLTELNKMAEDLDSLSDYGMKKYLAIREAGFWNEHEDVMDNLDNYHLMAGVTTEELYGEIIIDDDCSIPEDIKGYIDYKAYGSDKASSVDGAFTEYGFIERV